MNIIMVLIILTIAYTMFNPFKDACANGDTTTYCDGTTAVEATCQGVSWFETKRTPSTASQTCFMGVILNESCTQPSVCVGNYAYVSTTCSSGSSPTYTYTVCPSKQYCSSGQCVGSPYTCGNGQCDIGETEANCYQDCGSLSSWEEYYADTPEAIKTQYTKCEAEFDCNSQSVANAVFEMEAIYQPKTPKEWIDGATIYVNNHVRYEVDGGNAVCDEKASSLFQRALDGAGQRVPGNCIDYSTMFVAMARYKGIPAYQAGLCLTNSRNWKCETFSFVQPQSIPPTPLGYMSGNDTTTPQIYAHSVAMVYNPLTKEFDLVDPTMRETISKYCYGYSPVLEFGIDTQVCYISNYFQSNYCRGF